tara:strand:- start:809 stop:1282 length:474 start_codon:yes stop_codon:yes gene_type:complete
MDNAEKADVEETLDERETLGKEFQRFEISPSVDGDLPIEQTPRPRQTKRSKRYLWDQSLACRVLQSIGLVKTSNLKLIRIQEKNTLLKELMLKDHAELEQPEKCIIPRLINNAILMVLNEADVVYTTLITSTADWLRAYKKKASMIIVDEADAVTLA